MTITYRFVCAWPSPSEQAEWERRQEMLRVQRERLTPRAERFFAAVRALEKRHGAELWGNEDGEVGVTIEGIEFLLERDHEDEAP